jgi:hypothetical protein
MAKAFKILRLETENVKRIQVVSITPEGNIVEITGKNGNGKSSVLDSIFWALGGKDNVQTKPIRDGQQKASTVIELDGLTVTRRYIMQEDGTYTSPLTVEADELGKIGSPQKALDKLLGQLTFDPLEFTRLKAADQFDMLKQFVPDFDFDEEAKVRKSAFEARTEVNRALKDLRAQVAGIHLSEDLPDRPVDVAAISAEIQRINDANADIEKRRSNRELVASNAVQCDEEVKRLQARIEELKRQIVELEAEQKTFSDKAAELRAKLEGAGPLPEIEDASALHDQIIKANSVNEQVRRREERDALIDRANKLDEQSKQLTTDIDASDKRKAAAIAAAEMPVPGIDFGDGYLMLNGVPFDQASSAEQLRASVLMTMAANPKLRVILIRDGSLLDADSMTILAEMAAEHDYQVWIETVDSSRPGAVVIEDGMVKGAPLKEAAE